MAGYCQYYIPSTIHTVAITETKKLISATATLIIEMLDHKLNKSHKGQYLPLRRRLVAKIKATWRDISKLLE